MRFPVQNGSTRMLPFCPAKLQSLIQQSPHYVQNNWTPILAFIGKRGWVLSLAQHTNGFYKLQSRAPQFQPRDHSPAQGGPATHTAAPLPCTGHTQRHHLTPRSAITCASRNNVVWPQLIRPSPSIHKTQRQRAWLALRGNAGLTPALALFSKSECKMLSAVLTMYPVFFALHE